MVKDCSTARSAIDDMYIRTKEWVTIDNNVTVPRTLWSETTVESYSRFNGEEKETIACSILHL